MGHERACAPLDYQIEAVVTIDEKGQMVLPKGVRQKLGIAPGERLAIALGHREGKICCIQLLLMAELDKKAGELVNEAE